MLFRALFIVALSVYASLAHADPIGGRLSGTSGTAVTRVDNIGLTKLFLVSFGGNTTLIYDGSALVARKFTPNTQLVLDTTVHVASTNFDVYECWSGSAVVIGTVAYGTATTEIDGIWTNTSSIALRNNGANISYPANQCTRRGTIRTTGAGLTEDSYAKRFVSNFYNAQLRPMRVYANVLTWDYGDATLRYAHGDAANRLAFVQSTSGRMLMVWVAVDVVNSTANFVTPMVSIGINATNAHAQGAVLTNTAVSNHAVQLRASWIGTVGDGDGYAAWLEVGAGVDMQAWYAGGPDTGVGGITGAIEN